MRFSASADVARPAQTKMTAIQARTARLPAMGRDRKGAPGARQRDGLLAKRRHRPLVVSTDGQNRPKAPVSQKGRILRGWRRGGRIGVKSLEIASQNSFSIPFSQTRLQASFEGRVAPFLRQRPLSPLKSRS